MPTANKRAPVHLCQVAPELVAAGLLPAPSTGQEQFRGSSTKRGYGRRHERLASARARQRSALRRLPQGSPPAGVPVPAFVADHVIPCASGPAIRSVRGGNSP